jgi:subtilisin family serine protease
VIAPINAASIEISGLSPEAAVAKLKADPMVASAEFDRAVILDAVKVNDPQRGKQYALDTVNANEAWGLTMGKSDVTIAIVDSGVDLEHPDLKAKLIKPKSTVDASAKDDMGHGTHVAGIAAALTNNNEGIAGLAANAKIMPVRVLGGPSGGSAATVAEGVIYAADNGADVINMSLGFYDKPDVLEKAVQYALKKNVVIVATMGNNNIERKRYPAAFDGVIAVGSTDESDKKSTFSNFGDWISVSAPGSNIMSTFPTYPVQINGTKTYASLSGTSMAAPLVAGLAGLIRSQHANMAPAQVKALLEKTSVDLGTKGFDKNFGHGRIDAFKAVSN